MMYSQVFDPAFPLVPSEMVFLNGERFAQKVLIGNFKLMHVDMSVSTAQLGQAILTAAFLASDAMGANRLSFVEKRGMLGMRTVKLLCVEPGLSTAAWPEQSFEGQIQPIVEQLMARRQDPSIRNILYAWLERDSGSPWQSVIERVQYSLSQRGLLERTEERRLKIFSKVHYALPERTAALARQAPVASIEQMRMQCEQTRAELWKYLVKGLKDAIKARTIQTDTDID